MQTLGQKQRQTTGLRQRSPKNRKNILSQLGEAHLETQKKWQALGPNIELTSSLSWATQLRGIPTLKLAFYFVVILRCGPGFPDWQG